MEDRILVNDSVIRFIKYYREICKIPNNMLVTEISIKYEAFVDFMKEIRQRVGTLEYIDIITNEVVYLGLPDKVMKEIISSVYLDSILSTIRPFCDLADLVDLKLIEGGITRKYLKLN